MHEGLFIERKKNFLRKFAFFAKSKKKFETKNIKFKEKVVKHRNNRKM